MRVECFVCAFAFAAAAQGSVAPPVDVSSMVIGRPAVVAELPPDRLKGEPRQLAWSPDADELYVQVDQGTTTTVRHYVVSRVSGAVASVEYPPEWAPPYWAAKSSLTAPGQPSLKIEVLENHQRTRPAPFSGGFTNGGAQTLDLRNPVDTFGIEVRLQLLGQEVGYFMNEVAMAGVSYGWDLRGSGAIAFVDEKGHAWLFDRDKHKQLVPGTRDARLPAWSAAGDLLAFVQRARGTYLLMTSTIAQR